MASAVRVGEVYFLPIPGDNGETKKRPVVVLDGAPAPTNPTVAVVIFGCSNTKHGARAGRFVRVDQGMSVFARMGLSNPTSFHVEDIRYYDTSFGALARPAGGRCSDQNLMLELRGLLELRLSELVADTSGADRIPLLPRQASSTARSAALDHSLRSSGAGSSEPASAGGPLAAKKEE